jgi:hypothetical protein
MKKHMQDGHINEFGKYKAYIKAKDGKVAKYKKSKKQKGIPPSSITDFFGGRISYSHKDHVQLRFIEDLMFHVCQGYQSISIVESS